MPTPATDPVGDLLVITLDTVYRREFEPALLRRTVNTFAFIDSPLKVEQLRLNCTRLQELRISSIADVACVAKLLEANPGLRLLYWRRSAVITCSPSELKILFPLRQLRSLLLDAWTLDPVYLHQVLGNNANTLEELELGLHCQYKFIFEVTPMNTYCNGLEIPATSSMMEERQQYVETAQMVQAQTLLFPKLKSLRLELSWHGASDAAFSLVRSFPALETITLGVLEMEFSSRLARNLREGCPNLRSIKNPDVHLENRSLALIGDDVAACLVDACAPGNLVHAVLKCERFENVLSDSLLVHRDRLEVLELGVYHQTTTEALENIRNVVKRCKRLKRFSVYNYSRAYKAQDASILLAGVKECFELEHLVLAGFPFFDITSKNAQNEKVRTEQYLAEIKNEVRAYVAVLPPRVALHGERSFWIECGCFGQGVVGYDL
ncbi:MAG: hypothetical protein J3R72DRAFT_480545 [Linnemannia gamsii]|nr:MAG: hypothetical protein J3R72DRAFT_480545 [Linnemannia gamsii]